MCTVPKFELEELPVQNGEKVAAPVFLFPYEKKKKRKGEVSKSSFPCTHSPTKEDKQSVSQPPSLFPTPPPTLPPSLPPSLLTHLATAATSKADARLIACRDNS